MVSGADPVWVQGSGPRQKFGCGVFCGSDRHENFTERKLMSPKSTPERLCMKRSKSPGRRTPLRSLLQRSRGPLAGGKGNIPSRRTPHFRPFEFRSSAHRAISLDPPQCCRRIGPMDMAHLNNDDAMVHRMMMLFRITWNQ